jgi:hypothetical protein
MASYTVNERAVCARRLIDNRQYVLQSEWGNVQPRADAENAFLESHSWEEYGDWHLGLTEGPADDTKARYGFVYGDFRRLHRSGLIACHYRAPSGATRRSSWRRTSCCSIWTGRAADPSGLRPPGAVLRRRLRTSRALERRVPRPADHALFDRLRRFTSSGSTSTLCRIDGSGSIP